MIVYYTSAIPSVISLSILCFLPWTCRRSLSLYRALQAYDKQTVTAEPPPFKISTWVLLAVLSLPLWSILLIVMLAVTAGGNWYDDWPILASIRDAIPRLYLVSFVLIGTSSLITAFCKPVVSVSRFIGLDERQAPLILKHDKDQRSPLKGRNLFAIQGIAAIAITWAAQSINSQSAMPLIMISCCIFVTNNLSTFMPTLSSYLSFRGFVLFPVAFAIYQLTLMLLSDLLIGFIVKIFNIEDIASAVKSGKGSPSSWGVAKMFEDVDTTQAFFSLSTFLYGLSAWFTCSLVALAYRYDADQADLRQLSTAEADVLIEQSNLPADSSGRTPILLDDAALSPSKLTAQQLPTYRAALYTMLAIQILGIFIDALTGWQPGTFYPTREDQLIDIGNPFSISVWPFLAYPFVALAMIVSVKWNPERSFRSLWSYHEKWHLESGSNVKPADDEAGEELLELGKRNSSDE